MNVNLKKTKIKGYLKVSLKQLARLPPCGSFNSSQDAEEAGVPDTADVRSSLK